MEKRIENKMTEAHILDTILVALAVKSGCPIYELNLELRRCGFFLTIPETKEYMRKLQKDGYIE